MVNESIRVERSCQILIGDTLIGTSVIYNGDPSMGVATGIFEPSEFYQPDLHAHERAAGSNKPLRDTRARFVAGTDRLELEYFLMDFSDELSDADARQMHVFFPDWETYAAFFATAE